MNMRKFVAVMAAVLMLFSILPMGAFAASDVVIDINFDDGTNGGFNRSENENGYIVFDATSANWQNTWTDQYAGGFEINTDYVVTFKAKANKNTTMNFKINDNWGADAAVLTVNVTTEWQNFEGTINMSSLAAAIVMFSSNDMAADAATYYIDDVKVAKKGADAPELEVGVITNGNFENGSEGWTLNSSASIENGVLKLDNSGKWSEAAMANIAVEVGTEYTLSWKSQRVNGTGAYLMFVLNSDNSNHPIEGANWMNNSSADWVEQSIKFTATAANLKLKISPEVENAGVILIDDIKLTAEVKPEVGKITNGDFETSDLTGWTKWQSTDISADAAYTGSYGAYIVGNGGWGGMLDQHIDVEDGKTYEFSFWYKVVSSGFNWSLTGDATGADYGHGWVTTGAWTQVTKTFVANGDTSIFLNFNGGNTGVTEAAYIDDVVIKELKDPSDDGFIKNGDFETGKDAPWTLYSGSNVSADAAYTGDYGLICINPAKPENWGGTAFQDFSVEIGKTYEVTMWAKAISQGQNIQIQNGGVIAASAWFTKTEWTLLTFEFIATATNVRVNISGGGTAAEEIVYFDDIKVKELKNPSFDGYIHNGDFETGDVFPWDNLWGSCPTVEIVEGMDGGYGLHIVSGKWKHVRQTAITVEPNTWYKVTAWAKNASDMVLLVKDGADSKNLNTTGMNAGDEWTEFTGVFNSGEYTSVLVSLMGGENDEITEKYGIFDNISMEITEAPHEHNYEPTGNGMWPTCDAEGWMEYACSCGDTYNETLPAYHNGGLEYTAAVEAIDCANPGNIEYYYCPGCNEYFADANATEFINPWYINVTVDCVRPEGIADCANVTCETCGNEIYGYGEHDVLACKGGVCGKCGDDIMGYGCANYDTPACEDGVCYYCGDFVAGFGHENGAWAACCDGECSYGCGLTYPATEDHVDSDADDYCDNCWNHLAHIDEDGNNECDICWSMMPHDCIDEDADGFCDICWSEMPVAEIVYGDADGDGDVTIGDASLIQQFLSGYEVTLSASADADGDGDVTIGDASLIQQFLSGYDVTLGG